MSLSLLRMDKIMVKLEEIKYLENQLIYNRRFLHSHPEVGFDVEKTHDFVKDYLTKLNIQVFSHVGRNSLIGVINNNDGPIIGLRADMDALPMNEGNSDLSYCSQNSGAMHACGHDAHTAILLSTADYLVNHKDKWQGTIKLIFQEAEEGPDPGGAYGVVKSGLVDDVDVFFGLHCAPQYPLGKIAIKANEAMASADTIQIKLIGKGAHAAYPHLGIDPIMMQAELIMSIQTITSRIIDPTDNCVITIAQVHSGTTHNIIPETAFLEGTVRTFSKEVRNKVKIAIEDSIKAITSKYHGDYEFKYIFGYDALINQPKPTQYLVDTVKSVLGDNALIDILKPSMGAEDFSKYINHKTGAFAWLGTNSSVDTAYGLHHPLFNIDESALLYGTTLMINLVINNHNLKEILK